MKKIFILITFIATITCITSCSNDEVVVEYSKDAYEQLHTSIIQINTKYNHTINEQTTQNPSKRNGFWKWVGRVFSSLVADVGGSITVSNSGVSWNIKQGIDCSINVWKMWDKKEKRDTTALKPKIAKSPEAININKYAIPTLNGNLLENNAGYVHNSVIINLYNKYGEEFKNFTDMQIKKSINEEYINVIRNANLTTNVPINDTIDTKTVQHICEIAENCEDVNEFISALKKEYPLCKQDLDILKIAMEEIINGEIQNEDIDNYTIEIVDAINISQIPTNNKTILKTTIGVAGASSQLWIHQ